MCEKLSYMEGTVGTFVWSNYRNTIAGDERVFIYFEKIKFASQKVLNFLFFSKKKSVKMTLNGLETPKDCKN